MVNTSLISNSINSNDTALYLQPTGNLPINLLAGLMTLTPDGQVVINGDLSVKGALTAQTITTNDLIIASGAIASASASPSASSSATLASNASIGTGTIASGSAEVKVENSKVVDSTYIYLTPITDTQNQVLYVKNKTSCSLQDPSTALGMTKAVLGMTSCIPSFTAAVNASASAEILFNYWLIQTR